MAIMSSLLCKIFRTHEIRYCDLTCAGICVLLLCGLAYIYATDYEAFVGIATILGVAVVCAVACIGMNCEDVAVVCPKYKK